VAQGVPGRLDYSSSGVHSEIYFLARWPSVINSTQVINLTDDTYLGTT